MAKVIVYKVPLIVYRVWVIVCTVPHIVAEYDFSPFFSTYIYAFLLNSAKTFDIIEFTNHMVYRGTLAYVN